MPRTQPPSPIPPAAPVSPPARPPMLPVSPPPASASRARTSWIVIGGIIGVLFLIALAIPDKDNEQPIAPQPMLPQPVEPNTQPPPTAADNSAVGIHTALVWRDSALRFNGSIQWDGRSNVAQVRASVTDAITGRALAEGPWQAAGSYDPQGRLVFATQVQVPGDSMTAGTHTHNVYLVFEKRGYAWVFARNCELPGKCFEAGS